MPFAFSSLPCATDTPAQSFFILMSIRFLHPFFRLIILAAFALSSVWAQETKPELQIATGHASNSSGELIIAEEKLLITSDNDNEFKAWDLVTGKVLKTWAMPASAQRAVYVKDRGWLVFSSDEGVDIYRISDLALVANVKGSKIRSPLYDPVAKRFYCTSPSPQGMQVLELDLDKKSLLRRATVPNPPYSKSIGAVPQMAAWKILPLEDGRLLFRLDFNEGVALFDPTDWSKLDRRPDEKRTFALGRPGELIAITEGAKIEVLDTRTFTVLRSAELPKAADRRRLGILSFSGFTTATPGQPERLVLRGNSVGLLVDPQTLQVTREINLTKDYASIDGNVAGLQLIQDDEWLLTTWHSAYVVKLQESRLVQTLGIKTLPGARLTVAPEGFRVFVSSGYEKVSRRVDFTNEGVSLTGFDDTPVYMTYSPDGQSIAFQLPRERVARLSTVADFPHRSRAFIRTNAVPLPEQANFVFSPDGRFLAVLSPKTTHVYEIATGRLVLEPKKADSDASIYVQQGIGAFSPDGNTFVQNITGLKKGSQYSTPYIRAYDLTTAAQLWEFPGYNVVLRYSPDGREILALNLEKGQLVRLDASTGKEIGRTFLDIGAAQSESISRWSLSGDGTRLLVYYYRGRHMTVLELPSLRVVSTHSLPSTLESAGFFSDNNYFITLSADSRVRLWKSGQVLPVATLVLFANGKDWCLHTPDFQFQASPEGMKEVYFVKGRSIIPLESLFEQFFTPGLMPRLLAGETLQPAIDVATIKIPPSVTLVLDTGTRGLTVEDDIAVVKSSEAQVKIAVQAVSPEAAIAEIRLYQNGKLVQATTRGLFVEDDPEALTEKRTFPLTLLPGENIFRAIAINAQRVESIPAELVIQYAPPGVGPVVAGANDAGSGTGLQLHLVIVGLNKYRNPRFNLNYAVADATAVREYIEKRAGGIFTKINTQVIFDDQAVKPAIVAAFQQVAAVAGPRDAFIFYYAGHGVMSGDTKPLFYLVPYDITQMYGADEKLTSSAISSVELQELSRLIPAQKQLFVLDACQSAGALEAIAVRGAAEQKAIAQLARSSGTHWLTASGSEQFATEFAELGHGAFTYVLLQGLAGKADSGDGRVTVNELKAFLESELPEVTQKHKGTPQFPASYGFGQDFPLTIGN